jgi:energy-coupling factor transport system ATP-binding protein
MNHELKRLRANLSAYDGPNFSGRSKSLHDAVQAGKGVGLGGSVNSAISGLHDTIKGELLFYCGSDDKIFNKMSELSTGFGLDKIWLQNPFSGQCSGGQEAALAILCRLALGRDILGLDICVEQLSMEARQFLYNSVIPAFPNTQVAIVDNRLREIFPDNNEESSNMAFRSKPTFANKIIHDSSGGHLSVRGLSFGYFKNLNIFQDCAVSFAPGIHLLKGANGSGKSTLAKILAGLLRPLAGTLEYDSQIINPYRHPGRYAAYAFQDPSLQLFANRVGGVPGNSDSGLLDVFGLGAFVDKHPLDLSWVLRKRLSIAAALGRSTPIVILDEPTLGQDEAFCRLLAQHLLDDSKRGRIIIVISHSPHFAEMLDAREIEISQLKSSI